MAGVTRRLRFVAQAKETFGWVAMVRAYLQNTKSSDSPVSFSAPYQYEKYPPTKMRRFFEAMFQVAVFGDQAHGIIADAIEKAEKANQ